MINKKNNAARSSNSSRQETKLGASSPFIYREAYKTLRTSVMFAIASAENKSRSFIITSPEPNECKSTVSANLAIALSQLEVKVLLLDADLRNPTQHKIFETGNVCGLTQLIVGFNEFEDVINRNVVPNLDIITSGSIAPNPSELLGSANMADLLKSFEKEYEYVVVDTPPVNIVTDALMFADMTCGIIVAARQNTTTYNSLAKTIESIKLTKSPILGVVLMDTTEDIGFNKRYNKKYLKSKYKKGGKNEYGRYGYGKYVYGREK